jgi:hypothetical protein
MENMGEQLADTHALLAQEFEQLRLREVQGQFDKERK